MVSKDEDTVLDPPQLPEILSEPPARGKVLVLAPHPDDETIGLGGTLLLHAEQGDPVDVLYLTTGITGNADRGLPAEEYIEVRRSEARAACKILGVRDTFFWDYPDNCIVTESDMEVLVAQLVDLAARGKYEVVYTPHRGEIHSDHHTSAVLASRAMRSFSPPPKILGYEIWAPLTAECVVDVSRVYPRKKEAAACYKSQLVLRDITRLFECLNGYRSILLDNTDGFGEAFIWLGNE